MPTRTSAVLAFSLILSLCAGACGGDHPHGPSCAYSVASTTQSFGSDGGQGSLTITTATGCSWTAASPASWVSLSATTGSGAGTLAFTVSANAASDTRKTTLTVAGQPLAISQDGRAPCDYQVAPSSLDVVAAGAAGAVTVTTAVGCEWTARSNDAWASVSPASGTGTANVTVTVSANASTSERQTSLVVAGRPVSVKQAGTSSGPPPPVCIYTISPAPEVVEHWHQTGFTISIATSAGCSWTASTSENWLGIDAVSGHGSASVVVSHATFLEDATRRAAVQVRWPTVTAGQNVWVTQEGCRYGVDPAASFTAAGGTRMVTVVTQPVSSSCNLGCPWTVTSNAVWIHITSSASGVGDDAFSYRVDANPGAARVGTVSVAGRTHTVTQAGI